MGGWRDVREAVLRAYPGAAVGAALAILALGAVAVWWTERLERDTRQSGEIPATTG